MLLFINTVFPNTFKDSISYYQKHKEFYKGLNYSRALSEQHLKNKKYPEFCDSSIKKSRFYFYLNDTKKSLETLFNALAVAEKQNLSELRIKIIQEIGHRYSTLRDYKKAKQYYHKSLAIAKEKKIKDPDISLYQRLFKLHLETNSDSTSYYLKLVRDNAHKTSNVSDLAVSYNNYYTFYATKNEFTTAKKYLDSSAHFAYKSNDKERIATALHNLGYHYLVAEENYKKGIHEFKKLLDLIPQDSISQQVGDVYINLSYAYEQSGDFKNALDYANKYMEVNETIYEDNIKKAINEVETRYQIEKIERLNAEKQKGLEERQRNNHKVILIFIALFAFSTIMFYFFYQNLRLKQKNSFIEMDREVKQNIINATLDGQESERQQVASVLHDGISALLSSAGLHLSAFLAANSDKNNPEIKKVKEIIKEAHDNVRDLSHELVPPLLSKFGLFHALQDLCEKNSNSIIKFEYYNYIPESRRFGEDFELKIYYIVTELFNNIIKHSQAKKAYLTLEENHNQLLITVEDDGVGFDTSKSKTSAGFGLTQIKSRIKHLGGSFSVSSKNQAGTIVFIKIKNIKK